MRICHIEDTKAKLLVRCYPNKNTTSQLLEVLDLFDNDLTIAGLEDVMKIVRTSNPYYYCIGRKMKFSRFSWILVSFQK